MRSGVQYDPTQTQYTTGDKSTDRILFAVVSAHVCPIKHIYISNGYVHEPSMYFHAIYVSELAQINGMFKHGNSTGRLRKNLRGGHSAGHYSSPSSFHNWRKPASMHPKMPSIRYTIGIQMIPTWYRQHLISFSFCKIHRLLWIRY